ncbi:5-carboxymethyl-2-hydroxymuconate Delta-isomerase [Marinomonas ostreistagni]|uniref:5-carboxymethyl-2-hydroxymuconate Delta-isomerase n=1 Tax=Marinomonas ostreistagni TaxID=359209 RepID=A0ABS0ZDU1_9GAMM|nr:5-carboxymethyl-2-hydroxymuconate Delta-isomerase [Marinomonas ostreistagni]MBJ7551348.1 5-carboxymethyl-2-hydroxymuconate Delta-isomerase [Marinomonas ostreistagni]
MPHCIIEYSQNLEQEVPPLDWMESVQQACIESQLFLPADIKLRAFACKHFITGGVQDAFVHVSVRMLSGRTKQQKSELSQSVLDALSRFSVKQVSLSVEIIEMDNDSYLKKVIPA